MIRGQKFKEAVPQKSMDIEAKLHNRFDFEVIDAKTGEVKQRAYAENILLNAYWTKIFTPAKANGYIHVGTGSGTLEPTRTSLFTFLAVKASAVSVTTFNEAENWISHKRLSTWLENENMNTAWTEVGIAYGTSSSNLTTHALIKDLNGNPVTLNKGTTDIINVYSTLYAYLPAPTADIRFDIPRNESLDVDSLIGWMLGLSSYLPLHRSFALKGPMKVTSSGYSGSWSGNLLTAHDPSGVQTTLTGSSTTKKLSAAITRLPAASYNAVNGVKGIVFGVVSYPSPVCTGHGIDLQLMVPGTWYPYSDISAETVGTGDGTNLDFKTYFPFIKNDSSFVLKKNGTVINSSDYTVDYGEPNGTEMTYNLNILDYYRSYNTLGSTQSSATNLAEYLAFENPWYAKFGLDVVTGSYFDLYASNDGPAGPWTLVGSRTALGSFTIAAGYQHYRYWKWKPNSTDNNNSTRISLASADLAAAKNIHFAAGKAPASGDVITADYHCEVIAKTANNVFDLTVNITLQEKVV